MPYTEGGQVAEKQIVERQTHVRRLSVRLESEEVSLKVVHLIIHVLLGHGRVDHELHRGRRSIRVTGEREKKVGVGEREKREVPPDVMRVWIHPDLVFESAGIDLIIIFRIAPTTNTGRRVIKEGGIEHVMRV